MNMREFNIFDIPVHPAADAFPMMEEEELEELAADIEVNGLQQPLVLEVVMPNGRLTGEMFLIDGRNRREACQRAGVVPDYVLLDGQDPVAYILSANINRRHITKGQRAMIMAKIYPDRTPRGQSSVSKGITYERVSLARIVLRHAPNLAESVIAGSLSLDKAYEEARIRKGQADTYESRFNALKESAPDLAELVVEERLGLEEAQVALDERLSRIRRDKIGLAEALHTLAQHAYFLEHEATTGLRAARVVNQCTLVHSLQVTPQELPLLSGNLTTVRVGAM
jgi:hypothetical protein